MWVSTRQGNVLSCNITKNQNQTYQEYATIGSDGTDKKIEDKDMKKKKR